MEKKYNIGNSIKNARLNANLSQTELANKIGVSHSAISFWENEVNVPNVKDLLRLADVLNVTLDELVGRD